MQLYNIIFYQMIIMWKSSTGQNFLITANSFLRQRYLGTNIVVIKRVDCIVLEACMHFNIYIKYTMHTTITRGNWLLQGIIN